MSILAFAFALHLGPTSLPSWYHLKYIWSLGFSGKLLGPLAWFWSNLLPCLGPEQLPLKVHTSSLLALLVFPGDCAACLALCPSWFALAPAGPRFPYLQFRNPESFDDHMLLFKKYFIYLFHRQRSQVVREAVREREEEAGRLSAESLTVGHDSRTLGSQLEPKAEAFTYWAT